MIFVKTGPRVESEAAALAVARHPGVVELVDVVDGALRTVRVEGRSLADVPTLAPDEVAGVAAAVATTLADLHDLGVVHGGVEAAHVLVADDRRIVLCSLGRGGEPADDVAALGRLVTDLLAAAAPAPLPAGRWSLRRRRPARLGSLLAPPARPALEALAAWATDPDPERRPSARTLAAAVHQRVSGARLPAVAAHWPTLPLAPPPAPAGGGRARRVALAGAAAAVAVVAVVAGARLAGDGGSHGQAAAAGDARRDDGAGAAGAADRTDGGTERAARPGGSKVGGGPDGAARRAAGPAGRADDMVAQAAVGAERAGASGDAIPPEGRAEVDGATAPPAGTGTGTSPGGAPGRRVAGSSAEGAMAERVWPAPPVAFADGVLQVDDVRYAVGEPGDAVVAGDWACTGERTAALLRPATGEVFAFDGWASEGADVTARPVGVVEGASGLRVADTDGDGCDDLEVERPGRPPVPLRVRP